jgi:hypothetical protein
MSRYRYEVFGTKSDWIPGLSKIEAELQLNYARLGLFESSELQAFSSLAGLQELGVSRFGSHPTEQHYFIVPKEVTLGMRAVPQRRGGDRYSIDMGENDVCVHFRPGGIFQGECLISGTLACTGESDSAKRFFSEISSHLLKGFEQVKDYRVGPEAIQLLDSGFRLTSHHLRPPADCLSR